MWSQHISFYVFFPTEMCQKMYNAGSKPNDAKPNKGNSMIFDEMDFKSTIITQDEYTISKLPTGPQTTTANAKSKQSKGKGSRTKTENSFTIMEMPPSPMQTDSDRKLKEPKEEKSSIVTNSAEAQEEFRAVKGDHSSAIMPKPSLKSGGAKKQIRSVTWADERADAAEVGNLCEVREMENTKEHANKSSFPGRGDDDYSVLFGSAEASFKLLGPNLSQYGYLIYGSVLCLVVAEGSSLVHWKPTLMVLGIQLLGPMNASMLCLPTSNMHFSNRQRGR